MTVSDDRFFDGLPHFAQFEGVADAQNYRPLPDDWVVATADIVNSTAAITAGRYKTVNMAGASVISAILNAAGRRDLPFVFGGDGALVAAPSVLREKIRAALSAVQAWVGDELDLRMRAAIIPIDHIRAKGLDVRVARFQASDQVSYAMFAGGGASWAEAEMKAGRYTIEPALAGTRPDLSGLSCRWDPIAARNGEIVSIIAVPRSTSKQRAFESLVTDIIALVGNEARGGHPVPDGGPSLGFPPPGLDVEARAAAPRGPRRILRKVGILAQVVLLRMADTFNWKLGRFDPKLYRSDVVENTDFRKFDDGLKMTVDVDREVFASVEARLRRAEIDGVCDYGLHRQDSALMTCIVATPLQRDHVHFVDGAAGGYAMAALNLKAKLAA
ncbi:DUF3095 domain-containing protein [Arvimicrobium flavum]|uniref:DUF3095 domain-containing protein n=1 Tax=Arvimicrobium flavum TaxID=3393320 RepID=UPI00237AE7E9|nr:DUF3095 domain-containing protein [Mesorhizobium shangrilense]